MFILDGRELSLSKCDLHRFVVTLSHVGLCVTYSRPMCSLQCQIIFRKEATSQNIIDYVSPWVLLVGGPLKEVGAEQAGVLYYECRVQTPTSFEMDPNQHYPM